MPDPLREPPRLLRRFGTDRGVVHGDDREILRRLLDEQQYDCLFYAHGAESEDRRVGKSCVICPGSLHGANTQAVAVINTTGDQVKSLTF